MVNILYEFRKTYRWLLCAMALITAFGMISCAEDIPQEELKPQVQTVFDPSTGQVPYPNDVLYSFSVEVDDEGNVTENGHVDLPVPEDPMQKALFENINMLNGFSNYTPASVEIAKIGDIGIDPATINKDSVVLMGVDRDYFALIVAGMSQGKSIAEITGREIWKIPMTFLGFCLILILPCRLILPICLFTTKKQEALTSTSLRPCRNAGNTLS